MTLLLGKFCTLIDKWTTAQRRAFANDFDNLLVIDDSTNQSKSYQSPYEWLLV